jgi:hypothetical protein
MLNCLLEMHSLIQGFLDMPCPHKIEQPGPEGLTGDELTSINQMHTSQAQNNKINSPQSDPPTLHSYST